MYNRLSTLLWKNDISSKLKLVDIFKDLVHKDAHIDELENVLFTYISDVNSNLRITNFDLLRFYGPSKGLSIFTANQLFLSTRVQKEEDKIQVLDQLGKVLNNLEESKNPLLKITSAKKVIDVLEHFLGGQFHKTTQHRFLSIFFVPLENKDSNAAFDINTNSIAVFKTKEKTTQTPEYIFIHEFGHIVHASIFRSTNKVPQSFIEFNKRLNPHFLKFSEREKLEIYADMFSIAVMLDSEFESLNPFLKTLHRKHADQIQAYFINEIQSAK